MLLLVIVATFVLTALWRDVTRRADLEGHESSVASQRASERTRALAVLRAWDTQRAEAYATADVRALKALYLPDSAAGANDVALLKQYAARGLRIEGMSTQIFGIEIVDHARERLELSVTDRLASAIAVGDDVRQVLPRDEVDTRRISLRLVDDRWVVDEVKGDEETQPRPVESTARTPGS